MKKLHFYKYHGTGNDFIMVDNRSQKIVFDTPTSIGALCDRRFGIGADGLILLEESGSMDFRMIYFNADGREGSMCGNGGRCITAFAAHLGIIEKEAIFEAIDGIHKAEIIEKSDTNCIVSLKMNDVNRIEKEHNNYIIDTGSPHFITFVKSTEDIDVVNQGKAIRYNDRFRQHGINVNFVACSMGNLTIRTYERGVEDETLSCGTGSVAAALALELEGKTIPGKEVEVTTRGGILKISFNRTENGFSDVWLKGPAQKVYEGIIEISDL